MPHVWQRDLVLGHQTPLRMTIKAQRTTHLPVAASAEARAHPRNTRDSRSDVLHSIRSVDDPSDTGVNIFLYYHGS